MATPKQFLRRDWYKKPRFCSKKAKMKWRRARGRHNKIRRNEKGYPRSPRVGFKTPLAQRGFVKGMESIMIYNLSDLDKITSKNGGIIASSIGTKKRILIAEKAIAMKKTILNLNPEKYLAEIKKASEEKKKSAEKQKEEKKDKKEDKKISKKEEKVEEKTEAKGNEK